MSATPEQRLMEQLAAIEHKRWSDWHEHAYNNWTPINITRWNEQAKTEYKNLPEPVKELDRREVRRYLPLLLAFSQSQVEEAVAAERKRCADVAGNFLRNTTCDGIATLIEREILNPSPEAGKL